MTTALLLLHLQQGVVAPHGHRASGAIQQARDALHRARSHGVPVIHVRMAFRPGLPEVAPTGRTNEFIAGFVDGGPAAEICPELTPAHDDLVTVGQRASAFAGTDLDVLLRVLGADQLVLSGIGTSGVVLATFIAAADLDYRLTVLADACWDPDPELHTMLLARVFPVRATVCTVAEWRASLDGIRAGDVDRHS